MEKLKELLNKREDIHLFYCEDHDGAFYENENGEVIYSFPTEED